MKACLLFFNILDYNGTFVIMNSSSNVSSRGIANNPGYIMLKLDS